MCGTADHPLLHEILPSLGSTHPSTSQFPPTCLSCSTLQPPPTHIHTHTHTFGSFLFTFTHWITSYSSNALKAIPACLPRLDLQPRPPVNSCHIYPQHLPSITTRRHYLALTGHPQRGALHLSLPKPASPTAFPNPASFSLSDIQITCEIPSSSSSNSKSYSLLLQLRSTSTPPPPLPVSPTLRLLLTGPGIALSSPVVCSELCQPKGFS